MRAGAGELAFSFLTKNPASTPDCFEMSCGGSSSVRQRRGGAGVETYRFLFVLLCLLLRRLLVLLRLLLILLRRLPHCISPTLPWIFEKVLTSLSLTAFLIALSASFAAFSCSFTAFSASLTALSASFSASLTAFSAPLRAFSAIFSAAFSAFSALSAALAYEHWRMSLCLRDQER